MRLEYSLKSLADHVTAAAIGQHLETIERMRNSLGVELARGKGGLMRTGSTVNTLGRGAIVKFLVLPLLVVLLIVGYKLSARRIHKKQWGEPLPTRRDHCWSAISVHTAEEINSYLKSSTCDCGNNLYQDEAPPAQERLDTTGKA